MRRRRARRRGAGRGAARGERGAGVGADNGGLGAAHQLSAKAAIEPDEKLMKRSLPLVHLRSLSGNTVSGGTSTSSPLAAPPAATTTAVDAAVDAAGSATDGTAFSSGGFLAGSGGLGTSGFGGCASRVALCECCASSSFASSSPMVASRSLSWLCSLASARLRVVASSGCRASTACQRERSGHGAGRGAGRTAPGFDAGYRCELLLIRM